MFLVHSLLVVEDNIPLVEGGLGTGHCPVGSWVLQAEQEEGHLDNRWSAHQEDAEQEEGHLDNLEDTEHFLVVGTVHSLYMSLSRISQVLKASKS